MSLLVQDSGGGGAGGPLSQESAEMVKAALESGASVEQVGDNVFSWQVSVLKKLNLKNLCAGLAVGATAAGRGSVF